MNFSLILSAFLLSVGIYEASNIIKADNELIEVRGLSEKVVKSDVGEITIRIPNKNENAEELYKKIVFDKKKVLAFLKENGAEDSEIVNGNLNVYETEDYNSDPKNRKKYFSVDDSIQVYSKDLEKILKIKSKILELMQQKVFVSYTYSFKVTNFSEIKLSMMKEASKKARDSADAFIAPHGKKVGDVVYLRQGEISIKAEDDNESTSGYSSESTSINKKLRLVVRAGFRKI